MNSSLLALFLDKYPDVWLRFMEHMNMTTMAVLLSIAIGVPLGILITRNKTASNIVIGIANLMQSIPCIALLAFSVPFVGIGEKPAIIMVIIYALLPIIKNTYTGISSIDPKLREAAEGIGLSSWQKLIKVEMPLAMPFIMAGIRISTVAAVGTMTIAAFAGAGGLGWFINMGLIGLNIDMVLLGAIPASVLALLIDYILAKAENLLVPEGLKPAGQIKNDKLEKHTFQKVVVAGLCTLLVIMPLGVKGYAYIKDATQKTIVVGTSNFTEVFILGYMYEDLIEEKVSSEDIFDGVLLHVKRDYVKLPNGNKAVREWIKHQGASAVIPVLPNGNIILVRQYRYPIGKVTLEIPAGKLDSVDEDPLICAKRELSEETGYTANKYTQIHKLATTVGFSNEWIYIYLAQDLVKGKQHTDDDEFINLVEMPLSEAVDLVNKGEIFDAKSVVAILMAEKLCKQ